jgi:NADPH:quinone reductase-like Zn-dependent oxidoreductase
LMESNKALMGFFLGAFLPHRMTELASAFARLWAWIHEGKIVPIIGQNFPLSGLVDAFVHLEQRRSVGKTIIHI